MPKLICPVCSAELERCPQIFRCSGGHCYDISKYNYVNLLMSNRSSDKRHGDDKLMVRARKSFLEKDHYLFLRDEMCRLAAEFCPEKVDMLDAGCGEGWYSCGIKKALERSGKSCNAAGVDISKNALSYAGRRDPYIDWIVASVSSLPLMDSSCNLLLNVFAPHDDAQFRRVLRAGGLLLKVMPMENHLLGLKRAVYDMPYVNPPAEYVPEGFELLKKVELKQQLHLDTTEDILNLFMMTPYYYKTGRNDQKKLESLSSLDTELEFALFLLRRV